MLLFSNALRVRLCVHDGNSRRSRYTYTSMEPIEPSQLRAVFGNARAQDLGMPDLDHVDWAVLDYFGWIHPAGHQGYVVVPSLGDRQDELQGLRLRRMLATGGRPRTHMCSWCHHVYRGRGTAMFSASVSGTDGRRRIGNFICRNLDCSLRIRNLASDPPTYMPETLELDAKVTRLKLSISAFLARANQPTLYG